MGRKGCRMDPLIFLRALAQLLGLAELIQSRAPDLIEPDQAGAPQPVNEDVDLEVIEMIQRGEL